METPVYHTFHTYYLSTSVYAAARRCVSWQMLGGPGSAGAGVCIRLASTDVRAVYSIVQESGLPQVQCAGIAGRHMIPRWWPEASKAASGPGSPELRCGRVGVLYP